MRHVRNLDGDEVDALQGQIEEVKTYLKENRSKVRTLLPWLTECTKEELKYMEDYFILRFQVFPSLKNFLKNPTLISYDSLDELFIGEQYEKLKQNNKSMGLTKRIKRSKKSSI